MLRVILAFIVGVLVGANALYYVMSRGDHCARCEAVARTAPRAQSPDAPSAPAATAPANTSPSVSSPTATSPIAPPPVAPTPLPIASPGTPPKLAMPLAGLTADRLSDTFGEARGGERRHEALDIIAPAGTPVLAVGDGHIEKLFTSVRGGLTIYQFDPSGRYAYYYAHLQRYAPGLSEGRKVKRGEVIAYVGNTGNADPNNPHLHFAVFELGPERQWWKGTAINPYPLLSGDAKPVAVPQP